MAWLIFLINIPSCQTIVIYAMIYLYMVFLCELKSLFVVFICSLYTLAEMFDLPSSVVHSTISKMIINEELQVCDVASFLITIISLVLVSNVTGTLIS